MSNNVEAQWSAAVSAMLTEETGGRALLDHIPAGYDELTEPALAGLDLPIVAAMAASGEQMRARLVRRGDGSVRFRVYRAGQSIPLADMLPLLDELGFRALDERAFAFAAGEQSVWLHDVGVEPPAGADLADDSIADVERAFVAEFDGAIETDGFNRLVLAAGLDIREIDILRAYARYLRQIGFPSSQRSMEATLARHGEATRLLAALFAVRFTPHADRGDEAEIRSSLGTALDAVPSLDDDRTLRAMLGVIDATVRTNAFQRVDGAPKPVLVFKLECAKVPDLPLPKPLFEIWVCSPRVEGVHLRNGRVARGGIRWSDRREDFRTEVLGLVKAQIVKNAVIVPTGAKGGFVVKRPPAEPDAFRAEGVACYQAFVRGLLDVTDNIVGGVVVPPTDTVRYDIDDPYLVVAADKGTATFSDIANGIAAEAGFWLGDAFASGGSVGYDHKAMGITARGAWESVRRHARTIGKDADNDPLTVVGIGDMSGDVFGNGLLRSAHVKLVAAFDHRHIFLDPAPDPAVSFAERRRLFELPRSSWADYDASLISAGGAVIARSVKSIDLSPEVKAVLDTDRDQCTPNELMSIILRAPVDVLWNGGIGTYIKSSSETHADVGDRANDGLRVNGSELRCRIVAEGGNLGATQRGRVEFALAGGLVNTDAIDNSAGVDCSDHEVNIKVLLNPMVTAGSLSQTERDALLESMTDEVADLVLDDNQAQTLALAIARRQAVPMVNVHARYLNVLETEGWLNRALEFLPTDKQLAERQSAGQALTTPEFAVLLAYTKSADVAEMMRSDLPDDPYLLGDLMRYFPSVLRERFADEIAGHRLRREIVATQVANQMVNLSGISFDNRMTEDTGAGVVDVMRAWVAARDVFDLPAQWSEIDALGSEVRFEMQIELFLELRRMVERGALWLLRHRRPPIDIASTVSEFSSGIAEMVGTFDVKLQGRMREQMFALEASRLAAGVPERLAQRSAVWPLLHTGFDVVHLAHQRRISVPAAAGAYWSVFDLLDLQWLWEAVGALPRNDRWQTQARSALRDDLLLALADLADDALYVGSAADWASTNEGVVRRTQSMFTEIRRAEAFDLTTLSVALRQLRNLALVTARPVEV